MVDRTSLRSASGEHTIEMILSSMIMFGALDSSGFSFVQMTKSLQCFWRTQGSPQEHHHERTTVPKEEVKTLQGIGFLRSSLTDSRTRAEIIKQDGDAALPSRGAEARNGRASAKSRRASARYPCRPDVA